MTSTRTRWIGLLFISIAISLIIVDSTIVNVAIPSIVDELKINSAQVQWVQESYTLVFAALLVLFGTMADRIGRRRLLALGVTVFTLASILAGVSPNGDMLIFARVIQGVGGAMVLPTTLSIINATFRGKDRAIAFAIWGSVIGGMAAVGPLLGGWLTADFSWRWAFGVNVPFGILVVVGVLFTIAESRDRSAGQLDVVGALLSVLAAGSLVFGLIEGRSYGWWLATDKAAFGDWNWPLTLSPIPLFFALSITSGVLFVLWANRRRRLGKSTMIALDLFSIPSFRNGNLVAMVVSLGELGVLFVLPMWMQNVLGFDAFGAGLLLLALAVGSFLASGMVSGLSKSMSPIAIVRLGIILEIAGVVAIGVVLNPHTSWLALAPALFVYGIGIGLTSAQVTSVVLAEVPVEQSGQASGTQSTARQIGSALGIAILGTILFSSLGSGLGARLDTQTLPSPVQDKFLNLVVDSAGAAIPGLGDNEKTADVAKEARIAFSDAARLSAYSAAGFLVIGWFATLSLGERNRSGTRSVARSEDVTA
ncbi:MFS transporter [Parafrigoribacterium soli]|uniref:MFS transporter n=1 Tax=Parafrigoribacterium soli TaxID=3144663 RepID=UPI0032EF09FA